MLAIFLLPVMFSSGFNSKAQTGELPDTASPYELEAVQVTGRRSFGISSDVSRIVTTITKEEISRSGIQSFADLLEFVSGADVRQRGPLGIQADISIRGSSFDHVMVLINGIDISDPQTGHLTLDIPIDPESIERIDVLEGPAARTLGPGAFMGAINIITRRGSNHVRTGQVFGDFGLLRTYVSAGMAKLGWDHFISAGRSSAKGYRPNTDHEIYNLYYRTTLSRDQTFLDFQSGYQDKKFGAGGFYSPRFPEQYEEASTFFGSLKAISGNRIKFSPHIYWRRKSDHFLLIRDNPSYYENYHLNNVYGSQFNITFGGRGLTSNAGIDLRSENILSNNIGYEISRPVRINNTDSAYYNRQFQRTNFSLYLEEIFSPGKWDITAGLMVNWNTGFPGKPTLFPGADIRFQAFERLAVYASVNRALHLPTFTDLFYTDPVNKGNLDLDPNRIFSVEGGFKYTGQESGYDLAAFYNSGKDIVDWLWSFQNKRFSPVNLQKYISHGITASFYMEPRLNGTWKNLVSRISVNYAFISINKSAPDSVSKYYNLKHKLSGSLTQLVAGGMSLNWRLSYQDRYGEAIGFSQPEGTYYSIPYKPYWLLDGTIKWQIGYLEMFAEVSNILNTRYIDAGSVFQPGRWLKAGISLTFDYGKRGRHRGFTLMPQ